MEDNLIRCPWPTNDPLYIRYHDEEWGLPVHDERKLLAKLILDGAQAGLSWITILRKRENYWEAFDQFDAEKMARYDEKKIAELMGNAGIVRNRQKINSTIKNAQSYLRLKDELGSFDDYLWGFVDGKPIVNALQTEKDYLAISPESEAMSKDLKKRGFSFVGPTICYAFMQAVGMVNDHVVSCFRYEEVQQI
ncbi:MAG: DNA-3-methyladenine glycosylase I [Anaerolineales bacterium]|uniref:DNA-3-methyladenine glycosylase I n=1 Tax=Candidatus Desulfolinea nitratireducens TaxID=2841698 RepID=A0A8J6NJC6_9CHLR|nr:DNA-3-methyladenine glycosylase I [Candidatus Desulfolinea nitratireducens]MBL6960870.1 DNA-3-methyladenine glycosylase I [Anaerolineales bacterium]